MTIGAFHSSLFRRRPFNLSLLLPAGEIILLAIVPLYLVIIRPLPENYLAVPGPGYLVIFGFLSGKPTSFL
jgi:hypothetical protein